MFCQKCGAETAAESTIYCTACGNVLRSADAAFQKGLRQGLYLFVLGLIFIPVWLFIGAAFPPNDALIESAPSTTLGEAIAWILMWMAFIGSAARIGAALLFRRKDDVQAASGERAFDELRQRAHLPSGESFSPAPGRWKATTSDLKTPVHSRPVPSGEL